MAVDNTTTTDNSKPATQIIGGTNADVGDYPFFIQGSKCGGSLIWKDIMLTAAHCYGKVGFPARNNRVLVGAVKRGKSYGGAQWRVVATQVPHYLYSSTTLQMDFMIVKLNSSVTNPDLQPVTVNNNLEAPEEKNKVVTMGFGETGGPSPLFLQKVKLATSSQLGCRRIYKNTFNNTCMLCAESRNTDAHGVCNGDSGGPLVWKGQQVGVVSFSKLPCATTPAVYSRVAAAYDWIQQEICWFSSDPPASCYEDGYFPINTTRVDFQYGDSPADIYWYIEEVSTGKHVLQYLAYSKTTPYARVLKYLSLQPNSTYILSVENIKSLGMPDGYATITYVYNNTSRSELVNTGFDFTFNTSVFFTTP